VVQAKARRGHGATRLGLSRSIRACLGRSARTALFRQSRKPNVYIDLSGWSPKYFSPALVQYANTLLKNKALLGSDCPLITPDRWLADFEKIPIRDELRPPILKENALGLLGLKV